ncbi:polysaccharide deacetylase family protein [Nonomuraea sp. SBT364]|uniref:polysaccharide deacetylase family protein n=1 Tax=Nonomuraea sp. SBT364 TaxID=1580530 RepID=UPI00066D0744|nr:polysaccharide deacetylase family protein [Nonomuraea sp. SBT364]
MRASRIRRGLAVTVALLVVVAAGCYLVMNARTFQLAGRLVDRVETGAKVVALTFDDGPDEHTREIIGILAAEKAPATFFVVGSELRDAPEHAAALVAAGHQLGNHTFTHRRMVFVPPATVAAEIEPTDALIRRAGQRGDIPFRPPTGKKLLTLPLYLAEHDRVTVMWDVEPDSGATPTSAQIVDQVREQVRPGSIVLLHPWYSNGRQTRGAIAGVVRALRADGYRFVTVGELLGGSA